MSNTPSTQDRHPSILTDEEREAAFKRARARAIKQFDKREHIRAEIETRWHIEEITSILRNPWPQNRLLQNELTQKMNGHFRMLNKTLPDLRPVDLQTGDISEINNQDNTVVIVANPTSGRVLKVVDPKGGHTIAQDGTPEWLM